MADAMAIRKMVQDLENAVWALCQLDQASKIVPIDRGETLSGAIQQEKILARKRVHQLREALIEGASSKIVSG